MKEIYRYGDGCSPRIYQDSDNLIYEIPVDSGFASSLFGFQINQEDLDILMMNNDLFIIFFFVLFHEIQSTFGTGHPSPRKYRQDEFDELKKKILFSPREAALRYLDDYLLKRNFAPIYFENFTRSIKLKNSL